MTILLFVFLTGLQYLTPILTQRPVNFSAVCYFAYTLFDLTILDPGCTIYVYAGNGRKSVIAIVYTGHKRAAATADGKYLPLGRT